MNYAALKSLINANIRRNGVQAITGQVLNGVLSSMVEALGAGYQFVGIASPNDAPAATDSKVFYIAKQAGTYANFGGLTVTETSLLTYDSAWHVVPLIGETYAKASNVYTKAQVDYALAFKADKGKIYKEISVVTNWLDALSEYGDGAYTWSDSNFTYYIIKVGTDEQGDYSFLYYDTEDADFWCTGKVVNGSATFHTIVDNDKLASILSQYTKTSVMNTLLNAKANENAVVHKSGNETINGAKRFTNNATFDSAIDVRAIDAESMTIRGVDIEEEFAHNSQVIHKTGNESIGGEKSFNNALVCDDSVTAREFILGEDSIEDIFATKTELASKVGQLSDLDTTDKSSAVNAINEVKGILDNLVVIDNASV